MISKIKDKIQGKNRDNKGAALVMVIVAIAFIGMLVAMVLYMAYCNYLMKNNDKVAKNNFYSAEYALDIINAGLQHDVSEAMSKAYVETMANSEGMSADETSDVFNTAFSANMKAKIQDGTNKWDLSYLEGFWTDAGLTVASNAGDQGAYLRAVNGNNSLVENGTSYMTLANLQVVYTDEKGFVSIITTDIRLKTPSLNFAETATKMNIENFSLIANNSLINHNGNNDSVGTSGFTGTKGSDATVTGNVFGGYEGVVIGDQARLTFEKKGSDPATTTYDLIADSLEIENTLDATKGLYVDEAFVTNVGNISVTTGRIDMDGKTYVGDDLDIAGSRSDITLSGVYNGYGNNLGISEGSSSILINGAQTDLDFSGLKELVLSGHAYVGAKRYDADNDRLAYVYSVSSNTVSPDDITSDSIDDMDQYEKKLAASGGYKDPQNAIPRNINDVMMGESISVKANQLLYMVPVECIGFKANSDVQVVAKNPMTYDEFTMLNETQDKIGEDGKPVYVAGSTTEIVQENKYDVVRLGNLWSKLGGVAYTSSYKAVYRRVNGTVLVYLYLDFGSSNSMANEFYKAYYDYDKEGIEEYIKSYVDTMEWSTELQSNGGAKLSLGGNAFMLNRADEVQFLDDSMNDPDKFMNMATAQETHSKTYEALMHTLKSDYAAMTSVQQIMEIFDQLVDTNKLYEFDGLEFKDSTGTVFAKFSKSDVVYPDDCQTGTSLIVAKGDVYVEDNYEGLIFAGGNIYICDGCSKIDYNPALVIQAMRAEYSDVSGKKYAYEVFGASGKLSYGITSGVASTSNDTIDLGDLITYENWKKE